MRFVIYGLCLIGVLIFQGTTLAAEEVPHRIVVRAATRPAPLGDPLALRVIFENHSENDWQLRYTPEESTNVSVHYAPVAQNPQATRGYFLGQNTRVGTYKLPDGSTMTAVMRLPPNPLTIKAGQRYEFTTSILPSSAGEIYPGEWEVWVTDGKLLLESGHVRLTVTFSGTSVPLLLAIASSPETLETPTMIRWAMGWLRRIKPDFNLQLTPTQRKETPEEKAARVALNKASVASFEEFWEKEKNSDSMKRLFAKINEKSSASASRPSE